MAIPVVCPGCNRQGTVSDSVQGLRVKYPQCKQIFEVSISISEDAERPVFAESESKIPDPTPSGPNDFRPNIVSYVTALIIAIGVLAAVFIAVLLNRSGHKNVKIPDVIARIPDGPVQVHAEASTLAPTETTPAASPTEDVEAMAQRVGGRVTRENDVSDGPIVGISFSFSKVTDEDLISIEGISTIADLDFHSAKITDDGLKHLAGLRSIRRLGLMYTTIKGQGLVYLRNYPILQSLWLSGTEIDDSALEHLAGSSKLQDLYMDFTTVGDDGLRHLSNLQNLRVLHLTGKRVSDEGLSHLSRLTNLRTLEISGGSKVTDAGLVHLRGLHKLRHIRIDSPTISDAGLAELADHHDLTDLWNESASGLTDEGLRHVARMTNLSRLILSNSQEITDNGIEHLVRLENLHIIGIHKTLATDSGFRELKRAFPKASVIE